MEMPVLPRISISSQQEMLRMRLPKRLEEQSKNSIATPNEDGERQQIQVARKTYQQINYKKEKPREKLQKT